MSDEQGALSFIKIIGDGYVIAAKQNKLINN